MTGKIFRKELTELVLSARFRWSTLIFLLLLVISLSSGIHYYKVESLRRNEAAEATYRQWLNQGEKNPHSAAHYGFYAYKPVSPLAIFDKGLDDYLGSAIWLEAHNQNETKARTITDKLSLSRFGDLTGGRLLIFIIPLLIIILGYNIVSAEKENGTLRMLLSTCVSYRQVITGKAMALFTASSIWLITSLLAMAVVLLLIAIPGRPKALLHLSIIGVILLVLQATVAMAVTALSAWKRQSGTALVTGITIWIVAAILIPRLNGIVATWAHPAPAAFAFQQAIDKDWENTADGHNAAAGYSKQLEQQLLRQYGVDSISQLNLAGVSLQAGEEAGNKIFDKHFSALQSTLRKQDAVISLLSVLSPLVASRNVINGLTETDLNRHTLFIDQAEQERRFIQRLLNNDYAVGGAGKTTYLRGAELWGQVHNFNLKDDPTRRILQLQLRNMAVLAGWLALTIFLVLATAGKLNPFA
jgi:ABC-2 type transport system permease protein